MSFELIAFLLLALFMVTRAGVDISLRIGPRRRSDGEPGEPKALPPVRNDADPT